MGRCFELGIGTQPNIHSAIECYQEGKARGNIDSLVALGLCYQLGKGVKIDSDLAFQYFQTAATRGSFFGTV